MLSALQEYYDKQNPESREALLAIREFILEISTEISEEWKYKLPFFYYKKKMLCYFWKEKRSQKPYIGVCNGFAIEHPLLIQGERKRMKALSIDPDEDLPLKAIAFVVKESMRLQDEGKVQWYKPKRR